MANLYRYRVIWNGLAGLPGISTFYFGSAGDPAPDLHTFFSAIATKFPTGLSWSFPTSYDILDDTTGQLTGTGTSAGAATVSPAGGANYAAAVGGCVHWRTAVAVNGRRVKGTTFLVPLVQGSYDNGTLDSTVVTTIQTAANALVASTMGQVMKVYSRPRPGHGFGVSQVTGASVPDECVVLRSRRD